MHFPRLWRYSRNAFQDCAFAGSVWAENRKNFASFEFRINFFQYRCKADFVASEFQFEMRDQDCILLCFFLHFGA